MIIALARPVSVIKLPGEEGTIILAVDTSGSMAADDLQPNRMEAAKSAARAFVEREPESVRIGIVSFSDNAFVVQAPTNDQDAVLAAINRLYPQRGTAIGRGLQVSLSTVFDSPIPGSNPNFPSDPSRPGAPGGPSAAPSITPVPKGTFAPAVIVLLTDGENNQGPDPAEIADQAAQMGVRVYTIGIGSKEGSVLHIQGRSIRTRLDEDLLKQVAEIASGNYYNASNESDLNNIYTNLGTRIVLRTEKTEVTAGLTGLAAALSIIGGALSLLWFNRLP
jgi:Ca-activated chloride channel family protein